MKKSVILAATVAALAVSSVAFAQGRCVYPSDTAIDGSRCGARASSVRAGGYNPPQQSYNRGYNQGYNNSAAWNSAAIGAAGMITGAIVSGIMQNNANAAAQGYAQPGYGYAAPPVYAQPGYGYAPPPVVYYQQPACVTSRAPVYDRYGRVTEFVQYCANSVR